MPDKRTSRNILIALLLLLLFNYPLLTAANKPIRVMGFPVLYLYLAFLWLLGIVLLWLQSFHHRQSRKPDE